MKLLLCIIIFAVKEIDCLELEDEETETNLSLESHPSPHPLYDSSSSSNSKSFWREESDDDSDNNETLTDDNEDEETIKTKRNSFAEDVSEDEGSHLSIPKPAALQSSPQSISLGDLNPQTRGQIFSGGHTATTDRTCGMCSRERNLCQIISGIFTRTPLPYGYSVVTPIPVGVCNVTIVEIQKSKNFFALRKKDGTYALNGDWEIQAAGTYRIAGTDFAYSASDGTRGEKLEAPGPILEPIDLMLIYQTKNPGIKYEYRVPLPELVGQQPSTRILPAVPNVGTIPNYNLDSAIQNQKNFQNVYPGPRRHNQSPSLVQPSGAQQHTPPRNPFANPSIPSNPGFPQQRHPGVLDNTGSSINNWNNQFLPARPPVGDTPAGRPVVLSIPSNSGSIPQSPPQGFVPAGNPRFPPHVSPAGSNLYTSNVGARESDPRFGGERFPGVLNTDPRPASNRAVSDESKFPGFQSNLSHINPSAFKPNAPYVPHGTTPLNANPGRTGGPGGSSSSLHRTRHNHGPRNVQPGPAVGGIGLTPITSEIDSSSSESDNARIFFPNDGETQGNGQDEDRERRRKKKSKKKKGKKRKTRFHWVFKGLTECSRSCGGGNQTSLFSCERRRKGKVVADKLCDDLPLPDHKIISCNLKPCPAKWVPGEWGPCSTTCGIGVQTRDLHCKQEVSPTLTMMVPEGACVAPQDEIVTKECFLNDCSSSEPLWKVSGWSNCSSNCGLGTRTRDVQCAVSGSKMSDATCSHIGSKPVSEEPCDMGSCVSQSTWLFSSWSEKCTDACENGIQTRRVTCLGPGLEPDSTCSLSNRPEATKFCTVASECVAQWFAGPWSSCSVSCGSGLETRVVKCLRFSAGEWDIVPEQRCIENNKPSDVRECFLDSCLPLWYTSDWGECSSTCEGGISRREVKCLDSNQRTSAECLNSKPTESRKCNEHQKCPTEATSSKRLLDNTNSIPELFNKSGSDGQWKEEVGEEGTGRSGGTAHDRSKVDVDEALYEVIDSKSEKSAFKPNKTEPKYENTDFRSSSHADFENTNTEEGTKYKAKKHDKLGPHFEDIDDNNNLIVDSGEPIDKTADDSVAEADVDVIDSYDDNQQTNELEVVMETGSALNVIPDKDAQGDESASSSQDELEMPDYDEDKPVVLKSTNEKGEPKILDPVEAVDGDDNLDLKESQKETKKNKSKNRKKEEKKQVLSPGPSVTKANRQHVCVDRIKNCHLVFRARLCRLKYYNKLCCNTCKS